MKKARKNRDRAALNSPLIRRPIQKCFWLFLLPTFAAFCIGFLYPFCKGFFLSFCDFKTTKNWTWAGIKNYIADGVAPPLANATLRKRARKGRKGAQAELDRRAQGEEPGMDLAKPLEDTGQMRNAVTFAIRNREAE